MITNDFHTIGLTTLRSKGRTNFLSTICMPYRFTFLIQNELEFSQELVCNRCEGLTKGGNRCNRRVCIGVPYCFQHLQSVLHLKIKPSNIPNAGKGLFALDKRLGTNAVVFRHNPRNQYLSDEICNYSGEITSLDTLETRYGDPTAPYAIQIIENQRFEDGAVKRGIDSIANQSTVAFPANARFVVKRINGRNHHIALKAIRNSRNGEEIFVDYGLDYIMNESDIRYITKHGK